jgi:hypothetical protein
MNGLQSLMQGAPTQPTQQPQLQQPQQAPATRTKRPPYGGSYERGRKRRA